MRHQLLVLALAMGGAVVSDVAADAAAPMCQGQQATVVGTGGQVVRGTEGADVIVGGGSGQIFAGGGDDLICVNQLPRSGGRVEGGFGDDSILVTASGYKYLQTYLGDGDDTFVGGNGNDRVGGKIDDSFDNGADTITTKGGNDYVFVGNLGLVLGNDTVTPDNDTINLGPGDDGLSVRDSGVAEGASLIGGAGSDGIAVSAYDQGSDVDFNIPAASIERGGTTLVSNWSSFENFGVNESGDDVSVSFVGTESADRFVVSAASVSADLRGGNDTLVIDIGIRGSVNAGNGSRDRIVSSTGGPRAQVDLSAGFVRLVNNPEDALAIQKFEDITSIGSGHTVRGNAKSNHIVAGCGIVEGLGGNDQIKERTPAHLRNPFPDSCADFVARGGPGNDRLIGSLGPDVLLGGPGRDFAHGRMGRDRCVVERSMSCER